MEFNLMAGTLQLIVSSMFFMPVSKCLADRPAYFHANPMRQSLYAPAANGFLTYHIPDNYVVAQTYLYYKGFP
jgi:hypothetical protein